MVGPIRARLEGSYNGLRLELVRSLRHTQGKRPVVMPRIAKLGVSHFAKRGFLSSPNAVCRIIVCRFLYIPLGI
jgi:hypothetical protein